MKQEGEGTEVIPPTKAPLSLSGDAAELLDAQVRVTADLVEVSEQNVRAIGGLNKALTKLADQLSEMKAIVSDACVMMAEILENMEVSDDDAE